MAYLTLKSSRAKIAKSAGDDTLILSQIIGSQSSYETPKKVMNSEDLYKWFGDSYPDYGYHTELLKQGASLLLYKPIGSSKGTSSDYIDYSGYPTDSQVYSDPVEFPVPFDRTKFIVGLEEYIWENGGWMTAPKDCRYQTSERVYSSLGEIEIPGYTGHSMLLQCIGPEKIDLYVWLDEFQEYCDVDLLPQNLGIVDTSISWNNRDTLDLMTVGKIRVGHRRYEEDEIPEEIRGRSEKVLNSYNEDKVENRETHVYAFDLDFSGVKSFPRNSYICLYDGYDTKRIMFYFNPEPIGLPGVEFVQSDHRFYVPGDTVSEKVQAFWEILGARPAFNRLGDGTIWSEYSMPNDYFYKLPGFVMNPNHRISMDVVSRSYDEPRIRFVSRTIGKHEDRISVTIEKTDNKDEYLVTISRNGRSEETHTGKLFPETTSDVYDYLEYLINRDSELVRVKINQYYVKNGKRVRWKPLKPDYLVTDPTGTIEGLVYYPEKSQYFLNGELLDNPDLPVGTWELKGATQENYLPEDYQRGLECFTEYGTKSDFLMIPRMSDYRTVTDLSRYSWYPEYEVILDHCKTNNTQALISNNDTGVEVQELPKYPEPGIVYKKGNTYYRAVEGSLIETTLREDCNPWLNEFTWNYIKTTDSLENPVDFDLENYLVYFYREIQTGAGLRPGYYVFLRSILTDTFVFKVNTILYQSPVSDPLVVPDGLPIEECLENKKSNYLVTDGFGYYYKKYLNHVGTGNYITSILTRYFQSKLTRSFDYNKWYIIDSLTDAELLEKVNGVLTRFMASSSLIYSVGLESYDINRRTESAEFYVTLRTKELIDKNINLYVTLNYTQ